MRSFLMIFFAIIIMVGCTNVENNYFYCVSYDEDGNCTEWAETDVDPRVDNEVSDKDQIKIDEDNVVENENEVDENFVDIDTYEEIPDEENCNNPCYLLKDPYDGFLGKDKENGEMMILSTTKDNCACRTLMNINDNYYESFFGYYFPLISETKNTLDLGSTENEIIFTTIADDKKRYFEKQ